MSTTNWPGGIDRSSENWTGRTKRISDWGGNWAPDSDTPSCGWPLAIVAVVAVVALGIFVLRVGAAVGF
jgi:hypothetical protein